MDPDQASDHNQASELDQASEHDKASMPAQAGIPTAPPTQRVSLVGSVTNSPIDAVDRLVRTGTLAQIRTEQTVVRRATTLTCNFVIDQITKGRSRQGAMKIRDRANSLLAQLEVFNQHLSSVAVDQADFDRQLLRHLEYVDKVEEKKERLAEYLESRRNDTPSLAALSIVHLFDRSSVGQALVDNASVITEDEAISVRSGQPVVQQGPSAGLTGAAVNSGASLLG